MTSVSDNDKDFFIFRIEREFQESERIAKAKAEKLKEIINNQLRLFLYYLNCEMEKERVKIKKLVNVDLKEN